jgi:hypothetical protein
MTISIKLGYLNNETVGHMLETQNLIKFLKTIKGLKEMLPYIIRMTILISQKISKLKYNQSNIHVFKYDLGKHYRMNKIKTFIKATIQQIPNYINRIYFLNINYNGLAYNNGWMDSCQMRFNEIEDIDEDYTFLKDNKINFNNLFARYLNIRMTDELPPVTDSEMSLRTNKYYESKIYVIRSFKTDKVYIGSTIKKLSERFSCHKSLSNKTSSKIIIEYGDAYIELLELCHFDSSIELREKEGEYILRNKDNTVNKCVPGRTSTSRLEYQREYQLKNKEYKKPEYYIKNKITLTDEYQKEYQIKNKAAQNDSQIEYYLKYKEMISAKSKLYYQARKRAANPDASL